MGYMTDGLTFNTLRGANVRRLPEFKNARGEPYHPDGGEWSLNDWLTAVAGELGELAGLLKEIRRGNVTLDEVREDLGRELADVVTYLDLLAHAAGVDLGRATMAKWNEVSKRIGSRLYVAADDWHLSPEGGGEAKK